MLINQDFTQDRTQFIGGSDIGAILGLSPYRTPIDVWLEKTGEDKSKEANLAMRFGSFAEEFIAKEYAKARDEKILHGVGILLVGIGVLMEQVEAASGKVSASTQQALQSLSEMPHDGIEITASPVKGSAESTVAFLD